MATIDDINRQIQQEKDRHTRVINNFKNEIQRENEHHQRTISNLKVQKDRIKQANQQLENYNALLEFALCGFL